MKRIKFRAWDKRFPIMNYSNQYGSLAGFFSDFERFEIMQCTGLKDKQGKEIYEGDIIERMSWIGWCERCCSFEFFLVDFGCASCIGDEYWEDFASDTNIEVIGNIYENPELLEDK